MEDSQKKSLWINLVCSRVSNIHMIPGPLDFKEVRMEYSPPAGPPMSEQDEAAERAKSDARGAVIAEEKKKEFTEKGVKAIEEAALEANVILEEIEKQYDLRWCKS